MSRIKSATKKGSKQTPKNSPDNSPKVLASESDIALHREFMTKRANSLSLAPYNIEGTRKVRAWGSDNLSQASKAFFNVACELIAQKLEGGEIPLFLTGGEIVALVQKLTSINPLAHKEREETPYKQGSHSCSKGLTRELKQSKLAPSEFVDKFARGCLSDNRSPFYVGNSDPSEQGREIPSRFAKRYYINIELLSEYTRPSESELMTSAQYLSLERYPK